MSQKSQARRQRSRVERFTKTHPAGIGSVPRAIGLLGIPAESVRAWAVAQPPTDAPSSPAHPAAEDHAGLMRALQVIAINAWRARKKLRDVETGEAKDKSRLSDGELRRIYRHIETVLDVLAETGFEVEDHSNTTYDTGMALKVVCSEEHEGLKSEVILDTLTPTIKRQGRLLQIGEVVVGVPKSPTNAQTASVQTPLGETKGE